MMKFFLMAALSAFSFEAMAKSAAADEEKERCMDEVSMSCSSECPGGSMFAYEKCLNECIARRSGECGAVQVAAGDESASASMENPCLQWYGETPTVTCLSGERKEAAQKDMDNCVADRKRDMCSITSMDYMSCLKKIPAACAEVFEKRYGEAKPAASGGRAASAEPAKPASPSPFVGLVDGKSGGAVGGAGTTGGLGGLMGGAGGSVGLGGIGNLLKK
ncbi:MAG: hypothetical protein LBO78_02920 [Rickettsiales bacterium]|jgi:hypothetical protein|nr:hypothetical protein [Rickettsiales bacterium]